MRVTAYCPACFMGVGFESSAPPAEFACPRCGERRKIAMTDSVAAKNVVDRCVFCGCGHLYIEKDFNRKAGLAVIVLAIVGSGIAWAWNVFVAVGILAWAAVLDFIVWCVAKERTICYRCQAEYRGAGPNPAHERYELGTAGRFADDYDEQRKLHQE